MLQPFSRLSASPSAPLRQSISQKSNFRTTKNEREANGAKLQIFESFPEAAVCYFVSLFSTPLVSLEPWKREFYLLTGRKECLLQQAKIFLFTGRAQCINKSNNGPVGGQTQNYKLQEASLQSKNSTETGLVRSERMCKTVEWVKREINIETRNFLDPSSHHRKSRKLWTYHIFRHKLLEIIFRIDISIEHRKDS